MCSTILVDSVSGVRSDLVPDDLWERVAPLLPPAPERRHRYPGRLRVPDRVALAGVMYVLRTGVVWRARPRGDRGLLRGDGLAPTAGLDRGRRLAPPACRGRVAPRRPVGPRRLRGGRLAHSGARRGDCTGPSPVDRGRPGSKHHAIVVGSPGHKSSFREPGFGAPPRRRGSYPRRRGRPGDPPALSLRHRATPAGAGAGVGPCSREWGMGCRFRIPVDGVAFPFPGSEWLCSCCGGGCGEGTPAGNRSPPVPR